MAFVNLTPLNELFPQPEKANTFILSPTIADAFDANLTLIVLDLLMFPESNVTPDTPPTEVGNNHL